MSINEIMQAISDGHFPIEIERMIKQYGDQRASEAIEGMKKIMGIPLDKEIEDSLSRIKTMIDEIYDRTIDAIKAGKA